MQKRKLAIDAGFSKYDVYATADSKYCYRGTSVLRNKFGIRNTKDLKQIESDFSSLRLRLDELLRNPAMGKSSVNHLCTIHRYLLGDVYSFAGHFHNEDIAKGTTRFFSHTEFKIKTTSLLAQLSNEQQLRGLGAHRFIERAAFYFSELNYIHLFREGNGHTLREFMRQLFLLSGYDVSWSAVPINDLMHAMIGSVYDTAELISVLQIVLINHHNGPY